MASSKDGVTIDEKVSMAFNRPEMLYFCGDVQ